MAELSELLTPAKNSLVLQQALRLLSDLHAHSLAVRIDSQGVCRAEDFVVLPRPRDINARPGMYFVCWFFFNIQQYTI